MHTFVSVVDASGMNPEYIRCPRCGRDNLLKVTGTVTIDFEADVVNGREDVETATLGSEEIRYAELECEHCKEVFVFASPASGDLLPPGTAGKC